MKMKMKELDGIVITDPVTIALLKRIELLEQQVLELQTNPSTCIHDHHEEDNDVYWEDILP